MHMPLCVLCLFLALFTPEKYNQVEEFTNLVWVFFWLHLVMIVAAVFTQIIEIYYNFVRLLMFLGSIIYQAGVFYAITDYARIFVDKNGPIDTGHEG